MVDIMNMQVVDAKGKIIDHEKINWSLYSRNNFPYLIRQSTGCDNALGVVKFNLTSPYDVYMHDANLRTAFLSDKRYLSHGCIRLEKPVELGNKLLDNKLDTQFLALCLKGQKPIMLNIKTPVPVLVVYMPATIDESHQPIIHKDVYRLVKEL